MARHARPFWFRFLRGVVFALLALLLCVLLGAWWLFGTTSGARWLIGTALPYGQQYLPDNLQLEVSGIESDTLAHLRIASLTLSDAEGVWLKAEHLALDWAPFELRHGVFNADTLTARRIHFIRAPLQEETPQQAIHEQVETVIQTLEHLPDTLRGQLLPPIRIGNLAVDELALDSGLVDMPSRFRLHGEINLLAAPARLALALESLEGIETRASARLQGSLEQADFALDWQEASGGMIGNLLQLAQPAPVQVTARTQFDAHALALEATATAGEDTLAALEANLPFAEEAETRWLLRLPQPALLQPLSTVPAPLRAEGRIAADRLYVLTTAEQLDISEEMRLAPATAEATLHLTGDNPPFLLEATLRGTQEDGTELALVLDAEGSAETWDITMLNASMGADITTSANGQLKLEEGEAALKGVLSLPQLDASYDAAAVNLWEKPEAQAQIVLEKLKSPLPAPLDSIVSLPLSIEAQTERTEADMPDIALTVSSRTINGAATLHPAAQEQETLAAGKLDIEGLPEKVTLDFRHAAAGNGHVELRSDTLLAASDYALESARLRLSNLLLEAGNSLQLKGNATVDTDSALAQGELAGYLRSTAPLQSLGVAAPLIEAGKGKTRLTLSHPQGVQEAELQFNSGQLAIDGTDAAENVDIDLHARLPQGEAPSLTATLKAQAVTHPLTLDTWELTAKGTTTALQLHTEGENAAQQQAAFSADALLSLEETLTLTLQALQATQGENTLSLAQPATLVYGEEAISLSALRMAINDDAQITMDARLQDNGVEGQMEIAALPLRLLPFGAMPSMRGSINGTLRLSGSAANPSATLVLDADGLQQNYPDMTRLHNQPVTVTLRGELKNQLLQAQLSANAPDAESYAGASLSLPVDVSLAPENLHFTPKGTIDAALRADVVLGPFMPLLTPDGVFGTGHLITDMTIRGALDKPTVNGDVDLHFGQIEVLQTGTIIDDITFKAKADGKRITISDGSANDSGKGTLTFGGTFDMQPNMPMDIGAEFKRFVFMRHPSATATLSGDIALDGNMDDAMLKGKWHVDGARITIKGNGGSDVPEMRVVEVESLDTPLETPEFIEMSEEEREAARAKRRKERPFSRNLKMDIGITADNQIFLDGFGLTAELKGAVNIAGTAARPSLSGQMETVRGRWEFFGRTFVITRGKAFLSENNLSAPFIDIRAEADANDIIAIALITGTTENPKIDFSSIPALPKDEILARVMFGENLNSISPYQALQLADMIRSLSGREGSVNPLSKLQNTLGIDELTINNDSGNSEDVTVGVGKYVQENIYLEVEGGAGENSGKFSVEVDLTPNISVETEARQNADTAVRLNYKYDY